MHTMDDVSDLTRFTDGTWAVTWKSGVQEPLSEVNLKAMLDGELWKVVRKLDEDVADLKRRLAALEGR